MAESRQTTSNFLGQLRSQIQCEILTATNMIWWMQNSIYVKVDFRILDAKYVKDDATVKTKVFKAVSHFAIRQLFFWDKKVGLYLLQHLFDDLNASIEKQ